MTSPSDEGKIELKPCPFCGGSDQLAIERTCDRTSPYNPADFAYPRVICKCGVEVPGENWGKKATAITAWNRRASDRSHDEAIEKAAKVAEDWKSPLRPGSSERLAGQNEAAREITEDIRSLKSGGG